MIGRMLTYAARLVGGPPVEFSDDAEQDLKPVLDRLRRELPAVVWRAAGRPARFVHVHTVYSGYARSVESKAVLGVEVTLPDGAHRHYIVKIGSARDAGPDAERWANCTGGRAAGNRTFLAVQGVRLAGGRAASVYGDGSRFFDTPGEPTRARELREVAHEAVVGGPQAASVQSVEHALGTAYHELRRLLPAAARPDPGPARAFYRGKLKSDEPGDLIGRWAAAPRRCALRRTAVTVLAGLDAPDADPLAAPARYLDPVEYVGWAVKDDRRLPNTLVGGGHGDLHAGNLLVAVRDGRVAGDPVGYDFEDMGLDNVLAWDFAKMETELKVRLVPAVLEADPAAAAWLLADWSGDRRPPADESAQRIAAAAAFERRLADQTDWLLGQSREVVAGAAPPPHPTGVAVLDRLLAVLLRVRREAALVLGHGRGADRLAGWADEYAVALAVAGVLNVNPKWNYTLPMQEVAVVTAGVALARSAHARRAVADAVARPPAADWPSYRVPLFQMYARWRANDYAGGRGVARAAAVEVGPGGDLTPRPAVAWAAPLFNVVVLVEDEPGGSHRSHIGKMIEPYLLAAEALGDYETVARPGRLLKSAGDRDLEVIAGGAFKGRPPWQQKYELAEAIYKRAADCSGGHYFPLINAATLAKLSGRDDDARQLAERVAEACKNLRGYPRAEHVWVYATECEAAVLLGEGPEAVRFFRSAVDENPADAGRLVTTYRQLCRVWAGLRTIAPGDPAVAAADAVLTAVEDGRLVPNLPPHFLGRP